MTDDLTNPDVLAALEIAPVEYERQVEGDTDIRRYRLIRKTTGLWIEHLDDSPNWQAGNRATPADLDHALVYWLFTWLPEHGQDPSVITDPSFVGVACQSLDDLVEAETALLAVAAAVVKVGKETTDG